MQQDLLSLILNGDTFKILPLIPNDSIDLIICDPPYFLSNGNVVCSNGKITIGDKGDWDKTPSDYESVVAFNDRLIKELLRVLSPSGSMWIFGTLHNVFSVGHSVKCNGGYILNDLVWFKRNAPPNLLCTVFTHSHETILWCRKNKESKQFFNYQWIKNNYGCDNDGIKKAGKQMRSVWDIPLTPKSEKQFGKHPTQKPLELYRRIISASLPLDQSKLILDPFLGSGGSGVAARLLNHNFIGIDFNSSYCNLSQTRIQNTLQFTPQKKPKNCFYCKP